MSHRLQVLIPEELDARLRKAAQRAGVSKGEWVRQAIETALQPGSRSGMDVLGKLAALEGPTADIDEMLREIEARTSVKVFIDSNIPMYVAGTDHPCRDPALRFLARVQAGEVQGCTSTEVLQEILYRYSALKRPDLMRQVYDLFVELCPQVFDVTLADTDRARDLLTVNASRILARDAVHAAVMLNRDVEMIATFDPGFDHVFGIRRLRLD